MLILTFSNALSSLGYIGSDDADNDADDLHMKCISMLFLMLVLVLLGFQTNADDPVCAVH